MSSYCITLNRKQGNVAASGILEKSKANDAYSFARCYVQNFGQHILCLSNLVVSGLDM